MLTMSDLIILKIEAFRKGDMEKYHMYLKMINIREKI